MACEINSGDELVATEMIFAGVLSELEPEEAVALLSALVFQVCSNVWLALLCSITTCTTLPNTVVSYVTAVGLHLVSLQKVQGSPHFLVAWRFLLDNGLPQ